ncbi:hypothetical protein FRB90_011754 [Tulasnella sp. 427]|nr:hypothetical protein FRB90_011754 [Tulasnella sp. 427]
MAAMRVDHLAHHPSQSRPPQLAPIAVQQPPHSPTSAGPLPPPHHRLPPLHSHHHPHPLPSIDGASSSAGLVPPAQPTPADISQAAKMNGRKRKKQEDPDDPLASGSQAPPARRLRRLHEACARCRSKKIKCDSKLPSCSACQAANVECNQEDRHRQTLKPRGYTDMVEAQLAKCILLLEKKVPNFRLADIDSILDHEGIVIPPNTIPMEGDASTLNPALGAVLQANSAALIGPAAGGASAVKVEPVVPSLSSSSISGQATTTANGHQRRSEGASDGSSTVYEGRQPTSGSQHPSVSAQAQPQQPSGGSNGSGIKGSDPMSNNLSSADGLIKAFGVSRSIVRELPKPDNSEGEDVLGGVRLEEDSPLPTYPKTVSQWTDPLSARSIDPAIPQLPTPNPPPYPQPQPPTHTAQPQSPVSSAQIPVGPLSFHPAIHRNRLALRLPRNRALTDQVVRKYFDRLNYHRPVFIPEEFNVGLDALYDSLDSGDVGHRRIPHISPFGRGQPPPASVPLVPQDDPGFLCSVYLILALGRLAIDNEVMHKGTDEAPPSPMKDFPTHEEFFELALAVKPDLRVTISSLQALILLQWYLYTERHGRSLWRLVGNMVRLSVELGLHHDPSEQGSTFTPGECEVRNRLWWTVMIHDRGTSVLLGRPLAIADADFNAPAPKRIYDAFGPSGLFSEHFEHSPQLASIQGDIINALYRPGNHKLSADQIVRHASRITKGLREFSRGALNSSYRPFFEGTDSWTNEQRIALVCRMTEDQGLTYLKYGIARILLLRALFTNSMLTADTRRRALKDAVITSHNILIVSYQLTTFPSLAFFVSPIPIHIAAMVILYGVISECDALPYPKARDDVCNALHIVPRYRWRWSRKDAHGSHPLIVKLAQKVFGADILNITGPLGPPLLMPEWDWVVGSTDTGLASPLHELSAGFSPTQAVVSNSQSGLLNGTPYNQPDGVQVNGHRQDGWEPTRAGGMNHARNSSNGNGLPPTPISATMPSGHPVSGVEQGSMSGGSPHDPQQGMHYSPQSVDQNIYNPLADAEKEVLVRFMYPPPLDQPPEGYVSTVLGLDPQQQQAQNMMASQMMPQGMAVDDVPTNMHAQGPSHVHSVSHIPLHHSMDGRPIHPSISRQPTMHHHQHHPHQQQSLALYAPMQADYTPSVTHYVQEEFDGKGLMHLPPDGSNYNGWN